MAPIGAALIGAAYVWWHYAIRRPGEWSDFDQFWLGARALVAGENPYVVVARDFPWPLFYPLPALLIALPFAPLPLLAARCAFAAATAAIFTYAVLRYRPHLWPFLFSAPFLYALERGQWSPLLVAGVLWPALCPLVAAKPSIGLAFFVGWPSRRMVLGAAAFVLVSFLVMPTWPWEWSAALANTRHFVAPVTLPLGVVLLAGVLRWREPEGRMVAALAFIPQTSALYELVPLSLVPDNLRGALILTIVLNLLYMLVVSLYSSTPIPASDVPVYYYPLRWPWFLALGYVPALILVLLRKRSASANT